MTKDYQDFQHLDNENDHHQLQRGPPPAPRLLQRLCSGFRLFLLSLGLSILLLVVVCVITSQNSQLREDLRVLRQNFSNFTVSTEDQVKALTTQGERVGRKMKLVESQLEKHQEDLREGSERICCPINWVEYEGSCYWFSSSVKPWTEADKYCQLENAHLVVVTSWEEQRFVQQHMGPLNTWIGLTDQNGPWKWVDGTDYETGFKNWRPGQPDDWYGHGLGGGEDCAHFTTDGHWNDDVCRRPYRWVCETELGKAN
ncbi:asialoglycoprotein receptor 1, isoform CRA_b [Rattus norvegicus]|uniref:Asialoglycoprotein receptor 1, isoform CRA_b n=2 Tax=Rattus norvegicus TaxID=10116 RepID=A6HG18_RAT|nr:asialoglycoprotein receptor 1, isoform CRA_b [Rattus norvegicus]